ncbi:MAG: hypothetical protein A2V66_06955 [Ignavibacteria bacterium RBG_13_36_8]|nr:MAG: hypothetical protein A2V66_06955 [Ignavibacteria bacterium RBG_13_36_8]
MRKFIVQLVLPLLGLICIFISCEKDISTSPLADPIYHGKILLDSNPQGAVIFINGDNTGKVTPDSIGYLEPGFYQIKMRLNPYLDIVDSLNVSNDVVQEFTADFYGDIRNYGSITVNSDPSNALIYLRDSSLNLRTPATIDHLWPGLYNIACTYPEHRKKSTYVLVRGGEHKSTFITLQDTSIFVDYFPGNSNFPAVQTICIEIDNESNKWVGLPGTGLVKFREESTVHFKVANSDLPNDFINCISIDALNRKWVGTSKGLVIIDGDNWTVYTTENSYIPHDFITAIAFDSQGNAWIGATDPNIARLLLKFDGINWTSYNAPNLITSLAVDNNNRVWVGLNIGFGIFENDNWANTVPYWGTPLASQPIESIAVDFDGRVWVVAGGVGYGNTYTPGGLYVFEGDSYEKKALPEDLISHIELAPNGNKWISCLGRYPLNFVEEARVILMKIDNAGNITPFRKGVDKIPADYLRYSSSAPNGDLWIATRDRGIIKFKGANL